MSENRIAFDIRGVTKQFKVKRKVVQALEAIDIQIQKNEFVALLGTSGCGKSTLLRMLCGLDFPTTGSIDFEGRPIEGPGLDRGMVFQGYTLFSWMSVLNNVAYGLKERKMPEKERKSIAMEFVRDIGLEGFESVYPSELSGGMKQRVAMARALANNPDCMLLDEPFGALDAQTRENMQELTLQIWGKHPKTVIMVTHDVEEAILMADRVIVMKAHPGAIKEIMEIEIPRPRNKEIKRSKQFIDYKKHATNLFGRKYKKRSQRR